MTGTLFLAYIQMFPNTELFKRKTKMKNELCENPYCTCNPCLCTPDDECPCCIGTPD